MKLGHTSQRLAEGKRAREGKGRTQGWPIPSPPLPYLPRNQVLEAAQLVLVLGVVPGVLFSEEGLGGQTDVGGSLFLCCGPHDPPLWPWERVPFDRGRNEAIPTWMGNSQGRVGTDVSSSWGSDRHPLGKGHKPQGNGS